MPFVTDDTWSPARYRIALAAWQRNAANNESEILPRSASRTKVPRHAELAGKLRALLTWRAASAIGDWTVVAANDNRPKGEPLLLDSEHETRPRLSEIARAIKDVNFEERRHAKLGGGGSPNVVATGGDIERGPVSPGSLRPRREVPDCIVRLGRLEFSNGAKEEPALVRDAVGNIAKGAVRIGLGGITRLGSYRARDRFTAPKGAANDNLAPRTVGISVNANLGAVDFCDPLADVDEMARIRMAVKPATAELLDFAIKAANFREIGERLGLAGKHAERQGKAALLAACEELDAALAA